MKHVHIQRKGDREQISSFHKNIKEKTNQELVDSYNQSQQKGLFGVHAQALYIIALRFELLKRFNKSPITVKDNCIIGFTGKIKLEGDNYKKQ